MARNDLGLRRIERALISVSDKNGIVEFAQGLAHHGVEIASTGGTAELLRNAEIKVLDVSKITGFPECMNGRLKTLHPAIMGGILADRENTKHMEVVLGNGNFPIDLVVVNFYNFTGKASDPNISHEEVMENIDIGGPSMVRAAGKNYEFVGVVTDPASYQTILREMEEFDSCLSRATRLELMCRAFQATSAYEHAIARYVTSQVGIYPEMGV